MTLVISDRKLRKQLGISPISSGQHSLRKCLCQFISPAARFCLGFSTSPLRVHKVNKTLNSDWMSHLIKTLKPTELLAEKECYVLCPDALHSLLSQCPASPRLVHLSRLGCRRKGSNTSAQCVCTRTHL